MPTGFSAKKMFEDNGFGASTSSGGGDGDGGSEGAFKIDSNKVLVSKYFDSNV